MSGNPAIWIALAVIVGYTLYAKGYFKRPAKAATSVATKPSDGAVLTSRELGILFAQATRREAEEELAHLFAKTAGETLKASFIAPFSPPDAPAGQEQKAGETNQS